MACSRLSSSETVCLNRDGRNSGERREDVDQEQIKTDANSLPEANRIIRFYRLDSVGFEEILPVSCSTGAKIWEKISNRRVLSPPEIRRPAQKMKSNCSTSPIRTIRVKRQWESPTKTGERRPRRARIPSTEEHQPPPPKVNAIRNERTAGTGWNSPKGGGGRRKRWSVNYQIDVLVPNLLQTDRLVARHFRRSSSRKRVWWNQVSPPESSRPKKKGSCHGVHRIPPPPLPPPTREY